LDLKLRIFNKFADASADSCSSRLAAAQRQSFSGLPGEINVRLAVKVVALDITHGAD
jgi:hypothetical protein